VVLLLTAFTLGMAGQLVLQQSPARMGGWLSQIGLLSAPVWEVLIQNILTAGVALYALAAVALGAVFVRQGDQAGDHKPQPAARWELAVLVGVLLLACLLRLYEWSQVPPGVHVDEAINGLNALGILVRDHNTIYFGNSDGREILLPYLIAFAFRLFGISLFAFKMAPLAMSLLTIVVIYQLGRELFNRQVGLLAAFLMAVSKWQLLISRVTHEAVPLPLLTALVLLFLVRALRWARWRDYLACGLFLGLGMYTYPAFRAVPAIMAIYALGRLILERGFSARRFRGLAVAAIVSLAIFAPFGLYIKDHWELFGQRMRVTSFYMDPHYNGDALSTLWANTLKTLTLFYTDNIAVYYLPGDTVLDVVSTVLLSLGLVYCLWFWRKQHNALLPIWFAAGLLPAVLSHAVRLPHALRVAPLIPLAPLLVAVAAWYLWQTLARSRLGRTVAGVSLAGTLMLVAALNLNTYFVTYANNANVYESFDPVPSHAALAVNDLAQQYNVFVMPLISEHSSFRLLTYERSRYRWLNQANVVGVEGLLDRDIVCVLSPFDVERYDDRLSRLRRDYPRGILTDYRNPSGGRLYSTYLVRKEDIVTVSGLSGDANWGQEGTNAPILYAVPGPKNGLVGWYYQDSTESPMWLGAPRMVRIDQRNGPGDWVTANFGFSIIWRGQIETAQAGEYAFGAESQDGSWIYVDGRLVVDNGGRHPVRYTEERVTLSQGRHDIEVRYFVEAGPPRMELYWTPPGGQRQVVPSGVLFPAIDLPPAKDEIAGS
jgi:4-amino-4-deoxy-L-arabinose transferase-like glycosyltransferase